MQPFRRYIFNPETLTYEKKELPRWFFILCRVSGIVLFGVLFIFYLWMYTGVFGLDLPKTARLKRQKAEWQARYQVLNHQLDIYSETLEGIENMDDDVYRSVFGMNPIPPEVRNAGFGGVDRYAYLDDLGADADLKGTVMRMDIMMKQAAVQSKALDEVSVVSKQAGDMISHIPAVPPVSTKIGNFRLSSSFGWRSDPISGRRTMHSGMDFAADKGVKVYATGDGVVESVEYQFSGYGNQVIINHGFGYKTRYAHLSATDVVEGMTVSRGDLVGRVGRSGKSTGPHLHYEVLYKGAHVNPYNYMDLKMPHEEYEAMIERRLSDSELNRRTTTSDIISRTKR